MLFLGSVDQRQSIVSRRIALIGRVLQSVQLEGKSRVGWLRPAIVECVFFEQLIDQFLDLDNADPVIVHKGCQIERDRSRNVELISKLDAALSDR